MANITPGIPPVGSFDFDHPLKVRVVHIDRNENKCTIGYYIPRFMMRPETCSTRELINMAALRHYKRAIHGRHAL